jgi:hypothetical protein
VLLFPRYSHGMCLVKSVFPSIGAVKGAVLCGRDGMSEHEGEESEEGVEGWPALCYRDEQRDAPLASCGG